MLGKQLALVYENGIVLSRKAYFFPAGKIFLTLPGSTKRLTMPSHGSHALMPVKVLLVNADITIGTLAFSPHTYDRS